MSTRMAKGIVGQSDETFWLWLEWELAYIYQMIRTVFCGNHFMSATKSLTILLTMVGTNVYGLVHNLLASEKPADKVFREIVALMKEQ